MPHVFEDEGECVELGGGDIPYALQLLGRVSMITERRGTDRSRDFVPMRFGAHSGGKDGKIDQTLEDFAVRY